VVETKNIADRIGLGANNTGASVALTITERFTRTSDTMLRYLVTVDDPMNLDGALHDAIHSRAGRRLRDVRIRVPRGQPRAAEHPERRTCDGTQRNATAPPPR
jgi:hypothetical protein